MKKSIMAAAIMAILCFMTICVSASSNGDCGDNLTWSLSDEGILSLSGTGAMNDYTADNPSPWYELRSNVREVIIGSGVTHIGARAFYKCDMISSLTVPDSLKSIGASAFAQCGRSKKVNISSLNKWCEIDFADSNSNPLTTSGELYINGANSNTLYIPYGVTTIKKYAFYGYRNVTELILPSSVVSVEERAFMKCDHLTKVTLSGNIKAIGTNAFYKCEDLETINFPKGLDLIGNNAFGSTKINNITIPASVTTIGDSAFSNCKSLTSIVIPSRVTYLGTRAFSSCTALASVEIEASLKSLSKEMFLGCSALEKVILPETMQTIESYAFSGCTALTAFSVPYSTTLIDTSVFQNCYNITDVYYLGTEDDFSQITVNDGNDYLKNAVKHYNLAAYDNDLPRILINAAGDEISLVPMKIPSGSVIVIAFEKDDITTTKTTIYSSQQSIPIEDIPEFDCIKILVWNSLSEMKPVTKIMTLQ